LKKARIPSLKFTIFVLSVVLSAAYTFSQNLPTAKSIASEMGMAWNLGNTMEAPGSPTAWGNPVPNQQFFDSVKAAGFKTVRIPCAWDTGHANHETNEIVPAWMAQVKQVVDYCIKDSLFVVLNIHWDGGWLENKIDSAVTFPAIRAKISQKQGAYWRQIATAFRDYDRHLLFASANEPNVKVDSAMEVLNSFHQIFIDTVRATGGNNASRTLIIQGPNTDIATTNEKMKTLPTDKIADRLMAEVHFYPYQFCLMDKDADWGKMFYYWGNNFHSTTDTDRNPTWGEESFVDSVFNLMKVQFVDKNIPVLLGEFGAIKRMSLTGESLNRHILSRRYFYEYVASSSKKCGIIPVAWDAGGKGDKTMTIFDRATGSTYDLGLLNAMRYGWGMSKLPGDTSLPQIITGDNSMKVLYSSKDSSYGQVALPVVKSDMSNYDSIIVRAYVNGETAYDSAGVSKNGFLSLSLVTMSKSWTWRDASIGTVVMNSWNNYTIPLGTDTTVKGALVPADPKSIDFFAIQAYSKGYRGTIFVDWIVFKSKDGVSDTVYNFNLAAPEAGKGNVEKVSLISTSQVESDIEWKTATKKYPYSSAVIRLISASKADKLSIHTVNGMVMAAYTFGKAGTAEISFQDLQGKIIGLYLANVNTGANLLSFPSNYHGVMIVHIRQGERQVSGKVVCR
jgi:aryl-phospho-beta-D-glucosidase BglC (GH1 family)